LLPPGTWLEKTKEVAQASFKNTSFSFSLIKGKRSKI
jgi:hypothetical protein